jgi:elongation factor Ts
VRTVAGLALGVEDDVEALKAAPYPGTGRSVAGELTELIARIGENLVLRRAAHLAVERGIVAFYVHNSLAPGLGKIGVLVALESAAEGEAIATLGRQLAMQVAAAKPLYLDIAAVPALALERERAVLKEQARATAKNEAIVERMVEGRLRKFYEEVVLIEQIFVIDGERRVGKVIEAAAKEAGAPIRVAGFVLFVLGEGVERPPSDFAAEVGAQLKN